MAYPRGEPYSRTVGRRLHAPVATTTALAAIPAEERVDAMMVVVTADHSLWIFDDDSSATAVTNQVVSPSSGSGRWLNQSEPAQAPIIVVDSRSDGALAAYTRTGSVVLADAAGAFGTVDGVTPAAGSTFLLHPDDAAAGADAGPYVLDTVGDGSTAWQMTRMASADTSTEFGPGVIVHVAQGTAYADDDYQVTNNPGAFTLNTTAVTMAQLADAGVTASIDTRVSTEECTRATADTSLTTRVSTEECTRAAADTSLTTRVSTEECARAAADTSVETRVSTNECDIASNVTRISDAEDATTSVETRVSTNECDIASNATRISTTECDVASVETRVSTNECDIASNVTRISDAEDATTSVETRVSTNECDIASNVTRISDAEDATTSVETRVSTNECDIASVETRVSTNECDIASNATRISTTECDVASVETRVSTNECDIVSVETRVSTNECDIVSVETRVSTNECDIAAVETQVSIIAVADIPLSLYDFRECDGNGDVTNLAGHGGILASDSTPAIQGDANEATEISWVAGNQDPIVLQTSCPQDLDGSADVVVDLWVYTGNTNNDAATFAVESSWDAAALVSDTATDSSPSGTVHKVSATIGAADVPDAPNYVTIKLVPGAHATDPIALKGIRVNYTSDAA